MSFPEAVVQHVAIDAFARVLTGLTSGQQAGYLTVPFRVSLGGNHMWCSLDAVEVEEGPDLKNDPLWGWIHLRDGFWHTLGGTPVRTWDGKAKPKSRRPNVPTMRDDDRY